jgi:integral membrane protein
VKQLLKIVALIEALSFLLLLAATVVKRTGGTEAGVQVLGPVHGMLFLLYVVLVLRLAFEERWRIGRALLALLCAVLPLGGLYAERRLIDPA